MLTHMAVPTADAFLTEAPPPVVADLLTLFSTLLVTSASSAAGFHVFLDAFIIGDFTTLCTHRSVAAKVRGFHVLFQSATADELLLAIGYFTCLWDELTLHTNMILSLFS